MNHLRIPQKRLDIQNLQNQKLAQLEALALVATTDGFEEYNETIKTNYLWTINSLIEDVKALVKAEREVKQ
jgi:hypothetical protein